MKIVHKFDQERKKRPVKCGLDCSLKETEIQDEVKVRLRVLEAKLNSTFSTIVKEETSSRKKHRQGRNIVKEETVVPLAQLGGLKYKCEKAGVKSKDRQKPSGISI
jgi:hypothetical protein